LIRGISIGGISATRSPRSDAETCAYAFKVTHDKYLGALVFIRVFSGTIQNRNVLLNLSRGVKEIPQKLLQIQADDAVEINAAATGTIFAAAGLKSTTTGDSLTVTTSREPLVLEEMRVPPAVFSASIDAESLKVQRELEVALRMIEREDPSLRVTQDIATGETVMSGMGELHLEIVYHRLVNDFKLDVRMRKPRVAYKETVTLEVVERVEFDRELSGKRFTASMTLRILPRERGDGNQVVFVHSEEERELIAEKRDSIRNGALAALGRGALCGFQMEDVQVEVLIESEAEFEALCASETAALGACAAYGTRTLMLKAAPRLLEPIMRVDLLVPNAYAGVVMSEISTVKRRGRIESVLFGEDEDEEDLKSPAVVAGGRRGSGENEVSPLSRRVIRATVPLEGLVGYASALRSLTKGNGSFSMAFLEYDFPSRAAEHGIINSR